MGKKEDKSLLGLMVMGLTALAVSLMTITYSIVARAFVLTKLWKWFVVEQFGTKPLTLFAAAGLSLLLEYGSGMAANMVSKYVEKRNKKETPEEKEASVGVTIGYLILPWFALFFGYVYHRLS